MITEPVDEHSISAWQEIRAKNNKLADEIKMPEEWSEETKSMMDASFKDLTSEVQKFLQNFLKEFMDLAAAKRNIISLSPSTLTAESVGNIVCLRGRVVGQQTHIAIPTKAHVRCIKCNTQKEFNLTEMPQTVFSLLIPKYSKPKILEPCAECEHETIIKYHDYTDVSIIYLTDLLEESTANSAMQNPIRVYLIGKRIPDTKKVRFYGSIITDQKCNLIMIAYKAEPLESPAASYKLTAKDNKDFIQYFKRGCSVNLHQIAPGIIGRPLMQQSRLLILHSPARVWDLSGARLIRGSLTEVLYGDTKVGKSESLRDTTMDYYKLGGYCSAETSSRTGILYAIDTDKKVVLWGELPLNDGGYVVIDGMQKFPAEQMGELREALETQRVIVRKLASGEANCRARISAAMNVGKSGDKALDEYAYKCMGLKDSWIFQNPPDVTRWDLFIPFSESDVKLEDINNRIPRDRPIPDIIFKRHVYWVWSLKPEQIKYTHEAAELIKSESTRLSKTYHVAALPIVHTGIRDVLTRLSVAYACLEYNTEDGVTVIVDKEIVTKTVVFYENVLAANQLKEYKAACEMNSINKSAITTILADLSDIDFKILEAVKVQYRTSEQLAKEIDVTAKCIKEHYATLKEHGLIETKQNLGSILSAKGVKLLRLLSEEEVTKSDSGSETVKCDALEKEELVTEEVTNPDKPAEKVTKNVTTESGCDLASSDTVKDKLPAIPESNLAVSRENVINFIQGRDETTVIDIATHFKVPDLALERIISELENMYLIRQKRHGVYAIL